MIEWECVYLFSICFPLECELFQDRTSFSVFISIALGEWEKAKRKGCLLNSPGYGLQFFLLMWDLALHASSRI